MKFKAVWGIKTWHLPRHENKIESEQLGELEMDVSNATVAKSKATSSSKKCPNLKAFLEEHRLTRWESWGELIEGTEYSGYLRHSERVFGRKSDSGYLRHSERVFGRKSEFVPYQPELWAYIALFLNDTSLSMKNQQEKREVETNG